MEVCGESDCRSQKLNRLKKSPSISKGKKKQAASPEHKMGLTLDDLVK